MNKLLTVYRKELLETLRDKRTLMMMIVIPVFVFPLMINMMFSFIEDKAKKSRSKTLELAIEGGEQLPDLVAYFKDHESFEVMPVPEGDKGMAIREGKVDFILSIDAGTKAAFEAGKQVDVTLHYDNASAMSSVERRVNRAVEELNTALQEKRLGSLGVTDGSLVKGFLEPTTVWSSGIATQREKLGSMLGGMLPYFFIILCYIGALTPALDLGAGEKERGTLETLLLSPVPRWMIVMGKFLVLVTTSLTSALLALLGMTGFIYVKGDAGKEGLAMVIRALGGTDLLMIGSMLLPISALFAAVLLSISIYAKNHKEAQSLATPLSFAAVIPAVMATLPGVELTWRTAMIPITNVALAIKEIAKGTMDPTMMMAILGSSFTLAGILLGFCVYWFQREDVLFR